VTTLSREQQLQVVAQTNRAPSVHNTQPARWRFVDDGVLVFEDLTRRLAVGDPEGRDASTSVGAAIEGLHLALGAFNLGLGDTELLSGKEEDRLSISPTLRCRARSTISAASVDPLAATVPHRHSFRGRFTPAAALDLARLKQHFGSAADVALITDPDDIRFVAELNDRCAYEFMHDRAYQAEVYHWMRFSSRDPRWHRDGLTADCLAMNRFERAMVGLVFRPRIFAILDAIGVMRPLLSESSQVRSASAIAVLHRPQGEHGLITGRRFYRFWLEIARAGLHACPMSALSDSATGTKEIRSRWGLPEDRRLVNVFRIGAAPAADVAPSPRLPARELLV
jgi:hypothetical protein